MTQKTQASKKSFLAKADVEPQPIKTPRFLQHSIAVNKILRSPNKDLKVADFAIFLTKTLRKTLARSTMLDIKNDLKEQQIEPSQAIEAIVELYNAIHIAEWQFNEITDPPLSDLLSVDQLKSTYNIDIQLAKRKNAFLVDQNFSDDLILFVFLLDTHYIEFFIQSIFLPEQAEKILFDRLNFSDRLFLTEQAEQAEQA